MVHLDLLQQLRHGSKGRGLRRPRHDSSFLLLPSSIRAAGESVADWLQGHLNDASDPAMSAPLVQAKKLKAEDLQRVVKFYAKDCPHSQALDPIWKAAERDWKAAKHDVKLTWQQKECYTTGWKKGKDFKECEQEGVESFPTIKYFYGRSTWLTLSC